MTGGENGPLRLLLCHPERSGGSTIAPAQSNGSHARTAGGDDRGGEHKAPRFYLVKSYYYFK